MATEVTAPILGRVLNFLVEVGDAVEEDEPLLTLEALKMEIPVPAPVDGTVEQFCVEQGQSVESGAILAIIRARTRRFDLHGLRDEVRLLLALYAERTGNSRWMDSHCSRA